MSLLTQLAIYKFTDENGHALENCVEFLEYVEKQESLLTAAKDFREAVDGTKGGASFAADARDQFDNAIEACENIS